MRKDKPPDRMGLRQVIASSLQAAFGVQKEQNRARDFTRGTPGQFVMAGFIVVVVFVWALAGIVWMVMRIAT